MDTNIIWTIRLQLGLLNKQYLCEILWNILWRFQTVAKYKAQLEDDPIVRAHLDSLYDNLLEQNLCRIIEPFSRVQVWPHFWTTYHLHL